MLSIKKNKSGVFVKSFLFILTIFFFLFILGKLSLKVSAQSLTFNGDTGIQTIYQNGVPHTNSDGKTQTLYTSDSFFPKVLWMPDLGKFGAAWYIYNIRPEYYRDTLPDVKAAGFNIGIQSNWPPTSGELKHLNQYGLKTIAALFNPVYAANSGNNWDVLTNEVNRLKNNPGLFGYHLFYEDPHVSTDPNADLSSIWQKAYQTVHNADPNKTTSLQYNEACDSQWSNSSDAISFTYYFIRSATDSLQGLANRVDSFVKNNGCQKKPIWVTLSVSRDSYNEGVSTTGLIRPTTAQIRGQVYTAIIHGATGIEYFLQHTPYAFLEYKKGEASDYRKDDPAWGMPGGMSKEVTPDLWNEVSTVNWEIENFKKVIFSKTATDPYHISLDGGGGKIHSILKDTGEDGVRYLLAVNTESKPTTVMFSFDNQNVTSVTSLLTGNTPLVASGNSFSDFFGEYGTRLYRIKFNNQPSLKCAFTVAPNNTTINVGQKVIYKAVFNNTGGWGTVSAGNNGEITWNNDSKISIENDQEKSFEWTPQKEGTYNIFCRVGNSSGSECSGHANYVEGQKYLCDGVGKSPSQTTYTYATVDVVAPLVTPVPIPGDITNNGITNKEDYDIFMYYYQINQKQLQTQVVDKSVNSNDWTNVWNNLISQYPKLANYERVFWSPTSPTTDIYQISSVTGGNNIQKILKDIGEDGVRYLLVNNKDTVASTITFTFNQSPLSVVSIFSSDAEPNRKISPQQGSFSDNISSNGVDIYRLDFKAHRSPNCNLIASPSTLKTGEIGTFTAQFSNPAIPNVVGSGGPGNLWGVVSIGQNGKIIWNDDFSYSIKALGGISGTRSFTWTPSKPGKYDVFCRAWDSTVSECLGNVNYVEGGTFGGQKYLCEGPTYTFSTIDVTGNPISITPTPSFLIGDLNNDDKTDVFDYNILLQHYEK